MVAMLYMIVVHDMTKDIGHPAKINRKSLIANMIYMMIAQNMIKKTFKSFQKQGGCHDVIMLYLIVVHDLVKTLQVLQIQGQYQMTTMSYVIAVNVLINDTGNPSKTGAMSSMIVMLHLIAVHDLIKDTEHPASTVMMLYFIVIHDMTKDTGHSARTDRKSSVVDCALFCSRLNSFGNPIWSGTILARLGVNRPLHWMTLKCPWIQKEIMLSSVSIG